MRYFIIAGEASGDLHASNLMEEIKKKDSSAIFCYLGGDKMASKGGQLIVHYRDMAYMGFINVLLNARKVLHNLSITKESIANFSPDVVILVDYPSFNLRIAKFVKRNLKDTKVFYYISPKIWAWKEYRIRSIKKYVDKMFCILPFERDFYKKHSFPVCYVGNPSVDSVYLRPNQDETFQNFVQRNHLLDKPIIALLAGSRKQEIEKCLPKMLQMENYYVSHQFVVAAAPGVDIEIYRNIMRGTHARLLKNETYNLLQQSSAAIVNSGTATLETALINVPQVVVYHVFGGRFINFIRPYIINVKYIALSNLIAKEEISKELIAADFTETNLRAELGILLQDSKERKNMLIGYERIRQQLGAPGAAVNAANYIIQDLLEGKKGE